MGKRSTRYDEKREREPARWYAEIPNNGRSLERHPLRRRAMCFGVDGPRWTWPRSKLAAEKAAVILIKDHKASRRIWRICRTRMRLFASATDGEPLAKKNGRGTSSHCRLIFFLSRRATISTTRFEVPLLFSVVIQRFLPERCEGRDGSREVPS